MWISYFLHRFKVFADYEDYIKCQEKVNVLYRVGKLSGLKSIAHKGLGTFFSFYSLLWLGWVHCDCSHDWVRLTAYDDDGQWSCYLSVIFIPSLESKGMDQEGDLQHCRMWQVLQWSHHCSVCSWDLGHGAHARETPPTWWQALNVSAHTSTSASVLYWLILCIRRKPPQTCLHRRERDYIMPHTIPLDRLSFCWSHLLIHGALELLSYGQGCRDASQSSCRNVDEVTLWWAWRILF